MSLELTSSQRAFVDHDGGPVCALAVAGSGKTRALTARIAALIDRGAAPEDIVAVTFTKKAAGEMATRAQALNPAAERATIRTFHSLGYSILSRAGLGKPLLTGKKLEMVMERALKSCGYDEKAGFWLGVAEKAQAELVEPGTLTQLPSFAGAQGWKAAKVLQAYEAQKIHIEVFDFGDLIVRAIKALRQSPELATWEHVLVDEFQDTNVAQLELLKLLAPPSATVDLAVVGDDDQSIYGWRSARPEFLINFGRLYPGAETVRMEANFRSQADILHAANRLIVNNEVRVAKQLEPTIPGSGAPMVLNPADQAIEAQTIVAALEDPEAKFGPADVAVCYRTNAQSAYAEDALIRARIPYRVIGGTGFYGRREVKDVVAFAALLANPHDDEAFRRVFNTPNRYLGKAAIKQVEDRAKAVEPELSLWSASQSTNYSKAYMVRKFEAFRRLIDNARALGGGPAEMLQGLLKAAGYRTFLRDQGEDEADDHRWENVLTVLANVDSHGTLGDFVFFARNAATKPRKEDGTEDAVTLLTLHRAKGLEWPVVFIIGAVAGSLPHALAEDLEEERRLTYVGFTRARERLVITVPQLFNGRQAAPSPFLAEAAVHVPGGASCPTSP